tara:strand:+ start:3211 stop:3429 length:219 start_codon:yes stop_codon:yes gene_type:complete
MVEGSPLESWDLGGSLRWDEVKRGEVEFPHSPSPHLSLLLGLRLSPCFDLDIGHTGPLGLRYWPALSTGEGA